SDCGRLAAEVSSTPATRRTAGFSCRSPARTSRCSQPARRRARCRAGAGRAPVAELRRSSPRGARSAPAPSDPYYSEGGNHEPQRAQDRTLGDVLRPGSPAEGPVPGRGLALRPPGGSEAADAEGRAPRTRREGRGHTLERAGVEA